MEVFSSGQWATVCSDGAWTMEAADVVCHALGFASGASSTEADTSGASGRLVGLSGVNCTGSETSLLACSHAGFSINQACSSGVVSVACGTGRGARGEVRLVDGGTEWEGRVEILLQGRWGTVCDDNWVRGRAALVSAKLMARSR